MTSLTYRLYIDGTWQDSEVTRSSPCWTRPPRKSPGSSPHTAFGGTCRAGSAWNGASTASNEFLLSKSIIWSAR